MFEKLIESEPEGAEFKHRRTYFMVSSLVVGALFLTAVVISIFAADFGLGSTSFELTQMLSPVEMAAIEPEPLRQHPETTSKSRSQLPTRQSNMATVTEPTLAPTTTSSTPNTEMPRPDYGKYIVSNFNSNPGDSGSSGRDNNGSGSETTGLSATQPVAEDSKDAAPPQVKRSVENKPTILRSEGVINGKASYLPKPVYSAAAKAVRAAGKVDVQVLIDENGKVLSANAVSGHPLLRSAAEQAARNAKFTVTYLSNVPVKVSGVIIYNFTM